MLDGDEAAGLDCAHEVFDAARKSEQKLKKHPNIVGWLKLTAQHRVKREFRKRGIRMRRELNLDDFSGKVADPLQYVQDFDDSLKTTEEIDSAKQELLALLNADERRLYTLRYQDKMTYKRISEELEIPESTVRLRAMKVELKLRAKIME